VPLSGVKVVKELARIVQNNRSMGENLMKRFKVITNLGNLNISEKNCFFLLIL